MSLYSLIDRYFMYLDDELIELIEKVINSDIYSFLEAIPSVIRATSENKEHFKKNGIAVSYNFFGDNDLFGPKKTHKIDQRLKKHMEDLISLINYY